MSDTDDLDPTRRDRIERVDTQVGPYRLLELLGEGAMGEVWRAEQREPIRRIVALKIIKRGMDTREVITRFEIERQAMALMDHPWIAKVYDAGVTESGRPYIALEYVAGERLTEYCSRNRLSIEARLKLFQKVCQAIQHAHQKAVIHRDLKPSNILVVDVDDEPVPKIIDFGIAKATAQRLTDRSAATFVGQLIGTPLYMSPEQVEMSASGVDTRADVYSLGVILYELLSGALPHDPEKLARAAFAEILEILKEEEPDRPSTKISTLGDRTAEVAAQRGLDPRKLAGTLKGDLDWITLKALEKDRKRRYESPRDIGEDIDRYLRREPIRARPPSFGYRSSRFLRRHATTVTIGTVAITALIAFAAWQTVQSNVIASERDKAIANERLSLAREQLAKDPTLAVAYALSSLELRDQESTRDVVRRAYALNRLRDEIPRGENQGNPVAVQASLDGRLLGVSFPGENGAPIVRLLDLDGGPARTLEGPGTGFTYLNAFSDDSRYVAAIATNGLHLWRVSDGKHLLHELSEVHGAVLAVFPLEGSRRFVAMVARGGEPTAWYELDVESPELRVLGRSNGRGRGTNGSHRPAIDARGEWILDYDDRTVFLQHVADLDTDRTRHVGDHTSSIVTVACDRKGNTGASLDADGVIKVWDLRSQPPREIRRFQRSTSGFGDDVLAFDPHHDRFCLVPVGPTAELFDLESNPPRASSLLLDRSHWVHDLAFLPDGSLITARNGLDEGPLARWSQPSPVAWKVDHADSLGEAMHVLPAADGRSIYAWMRNGALVRIPVSDGGSGSIEWLGRTTAASSGIPSRFLMSVDEQRFLTACNLQGGARILDRSTGQVRVVSLGHDHLPGAMSPSGRRAFFVDAPYDGIGVDFAIKIVDLDGLEIEYETNEQGLRVHGAAFVSEDSLVVMTPRSAFVLDLSGNSAVADTLWRGSGQTLYLSREGRTIFVRDPDGTSQLVDLVTGTSRPLVSRKKGPIMSIEVQEQMRLCVTAMRRSDLEIQDLHSGEIWYLPQPDDAFTGAIDPLRRWIYSNKAELWAWKFPPDPLFGDLGPDEFLARARSLTNVRVVTDAEEANGYRVTHRGETGQ